MLMTMVQGIGKSVYGETIAALCGAHGGIVDSERMFDKFNAQAEGKTWMVVNELDVKFGAKEGQLNDLISSDIVTVEQKGKDPIVLPNLRRWFLTTNTSVPCRLSAGQRRVMVIYPPRVEADTRGEWGTWVGRLGGVARYRDAGGEEAMSALLEWYEELWYDSGLGEGVWNSKAPVPRTEEGDEAAEGSMTSNSALAHSLYEEIVEVLGGVGAVSPILASTHRKVMQELGMLVKSRGGNIGNKNIKVEGRVKKYKVYDCTGKLP